MVEDPQVRALLSPHRGRYARPPKHHRRLDGHEGEILRYVFFHSLALASLVGLLVTLPAYAFSFFRMVIK